MAIIELVQGDITAIDVDAIVNAANSGLRGGGGVDGAIHRKAGPELLEECRRIADSRRPGEACPTGEAVSTAAYKLGRKRIIHTAGPVWGGGGRSEESLLESCYRNSLLLAQEEGLRSLAFPNISTGIYGYPKDKAAGAAVRAVKETLPRTPGIERVVFVCYDRENYLIYEKLLAAAQTINNGLRE